MVPPASNLKTPPRFLGELDANILSAESMGESRGKPSHYRDRFSETKVKWDREFESLALRHGVCKLQTFSAPSSRCG